MHIALLGILVVKSRYLPTWIGALLVLAGGGYVINSGVILLFPALSLGPWLLLPGFIGEGALALWLLIVGLNETGWKDQVGEP